MKDIDKTKEKLIQELETFRLQVAKLRESQAERKRVEDQLRQSEEKYKRLFEMSPIGITTLDLKGVFTSVNPATMKEGGYSKDEVLGKHFTRIGAVRLQDIPKHIKTFGSIIRGKAPKPIETPYIHKDGTPGWTEIHTALLKAGIRPLGVLIMQKDITERKKAEQVLRESEEKYRNLVERANDGIVIIQNGVMKYVNHRLAEIGGYTIEEVINTPFADYIHPAELTKTMERYERRMSGKGIEPVYETALRRKDGSKVHVEINASIVLHQEKPADLILVRDITERKQAEEEHRQSLKKLQKAMESTIQAIALTIEVRDPYTAGHQQRVTRLASAIGKEMDLSENQVHGIYMAGVVHDIGKIYVPAEILSKPGRLTEIEFSLIKMHSQAGYDILKTIEFPWPIAKAVFQHHERMDGSGYPQSLSGEDILLEAQILAVADVVEAISSHRPYRPALGTEKALEEITRGRGVIFDAKVVDACLKLFTEKGYEFELKTKTI